MYTTAKKWDTSSSSCIYTPPKAPTTKKPTTAPKPKTTTKKPMPWAKSTKKHCFSTKHSAKYKSVYEAQEACLKLGSKCSGVYDDTCDGKGDFYACTEAKWAISSSSCIYTAPKPKTTTKKPTTTTKATKIKAIHCEFQYVSGSGAFKSFADAAKFCHKVGPTVCSGVYDFKCDGKDSFYACNMKPLSKSTKGSCVHKPEAWQKWSSQHCDGKDSFYACNMKPLSKS